MAKKKGSSPKNINNVVTNTFIRGLNKDSDPSFIEKGQWTHARNAVNNTLEGDLGTLSNESSNYLCSTSGETLDGVSKEIIGAIYLFSDKWIIFTTSVQLPNLPNSILHEIGLFEEDECRYRIIVQDNCLNFSRYNLISGATRELEDCSWGIYWADGLNPDRYLNIGDPQLWPSRDYVWASNNQYNNGIDDLQWPGVQWQQDCQVDALGCNICVDLQNLDCEAIRLARLVETPCLVTSAGTQGGSLRNGSYFAVLAYVIKGQKVTDYYSPSNVQPIYIEDDFRGGLEITVEADYKNFDEFELVIVATINQDTVAKRIGIYSTKTTTIYLDQIKEDLETIPLNIIPLQNSVYETSDQIEELNTYLLRVGPKTRFDFNYQPLANLIRSKWINVEYSNDYYFKGGSNTSYMRDEQYTFFIRWIYNTGDKSSSYHIPGRAPKQINTPLGSSIFENTNYIDNNSLVNDGKYFETYNTASPGTPVGTVLDDGGVVIATGDMGYWESTEIYPDNRPDIWNSSYHCWTGVYGQTSINHDLCGLPIRHHKFPDNEKAYAEHFEGNNIRIMGVTFENIILPKDNEGNDIPGIVAYEILRGSREGNKTLIAKGMINNMRPYNIQNGDRKGLYPNHPYNTIEPIFTDGADDPFIVGVNDDDDLIHFTKDDIPKDIVTFHSPDTDFKKPLLSTTELKIYGHLSGRSEHRHIEPEKHPKNKLISNITMFAGIVGGIIDVLIANLGKRTLNQPGASFTRVFGDDYTQEERSGGALNTLNAGTLMMGSGTAGTSGTIDTQQGGGDGETVSHEHSESDQVDNYGSNGGRDDFFGGGSSLETQGPGQGGQIEADYNSSYTDYFDNGGAVNEGGSGLGIPLLSGDALKDIQYNYNYFGGQTAGGTYTSPTVNTELSRNQYAQGSGALTGLLNAAGNILYYFSEGFNATLRLIYALLPYRQYALQQISHGDYNTYHTPYNNQADLNNGITRYNIEDEFYLDPTLQNVRDYLTNPVTAPRNYTIANLKRSKTVVLRTSATQNQLTAGPRFLGSLGTDPVDDSLVTIGSLAQETCGTCNNLDEIFENTKNQNFYRTVASHYGGIKLRLRNQYGQLDSVKQIPITPCEQKFIYEDIPSTVLAPACGIQYEQKIINSTPAFFGGDTYVNRYTEKNTMFMFYDWLRGQPDGFTYNYYLYQMIPRPRFWMNTERYEGSQVWSDLLSLITGTPTPGTGFLPTGYYQLDHPGGIFTIGVPGTSAIGGPYDYSTDEIGDPPGLFGVKNSLMYLFNSGVRDFYVESDVILDFREQGEQPYQKVYNPYTYTDLYSMFNSDPNIITRGNYLAYDYSLSISKLLTQYLSQGNLQSRYYDPEVAEFCYTYYPDRVVYSLPQEQEDSKDHWFIYLVNNYREFKNQISGIKTFAKTGLFLTFKDASPLIIQGVDQREDYLGTKATVGDGGLFASTPQNVTASDSEYEYGSSQNRLSVISTPAGMYYISQNQGKIFSYEGGLREISNKGLKWWFNKFLPYKLLEDFPDYPHTDNPVAGIGCQSTYDNKNSTLYFSKIDYKLKDEFRGRVVWNGDLNLFVIDGVTRVDLNDTNIFENASWTISYDPKSKFWISHHDWHPGLVIGSKTNFLTIKQNGIWKHNDICNDYCNFYGVDYPFEVELPVVTGQTVTTMKSIEYILECYKRNEYNCVDQFHVLDNNFDHAVIHNSEQVSGYLNLNVYPKNNVPLNLAYPIINTDSIDILFSKEENKYRFNQFWDITLDRGEFPVGSSYPTTNPVIAGTTIQQGGKEERHIWNTGPNGYTKVLNSFNLNYAKNALQRKKFRHYNNLLYLRKQVSGDTNMILKITNTKNQISLR